MHVMEKRRLETKETPRSKKCKVSARPAAPVKRDLLQQSFSRLSPLRDYVLTQLPSSSRIRRKKIAALSAGDDSDEAEKRLCHFLDTTLVGSNKAIDQSDDATWDQWQCFSQQADDSNVTISSGIASSIRTQSEVVCSVPPIWPDPD
jgi:telomerase reverse transcriptase